MSGYPTSTSLSRVDGLSTDPLILGHHNIMAQKGDDLAYLHTCEMVVDPFTKFGPRNMFFLHVKL